jgi:superfamily II DNA/RNA helicase
MLLLGSAGLHKIGVGRGMELLYDGDEPEYVADAFDDMGLHPRLVHSIAEYGYDAPSWLQQRIVRPMMRGGDMVVLAPAGTGKTVALAIALIQRCCCGSAQESTASEHGVRGLVLTPTRELAQGTSLLINALAASSTSPEQHRSPSFAVMTSEGATGATEVGSAGTTIAVGTPDTILRCIERRLLCIDALQILATDEAGDVVTRYTIKLIAKVRNFAPKHIQLLFFTSFLSDDLVAAVERMAPGAATIRARRLELSLASVRQFYVAVEDVYKAETLVDLLELATASQVIIYVNTCRSGEAVVALIDRAEYPVGLIHDGMKSSEVGAVWDRFRRGDLRVLVGTDRVAELREAHDPGLHINYDMPTTENKYMARHGGSGKFGRRRVAISFLTQQEVPFLRRLEQHFNTQIDELPMDFSQLI